MIFYKKYYIIYIENKKNERKNNMSDFSANCLARIIVLLFTIVLSFINAAIGMWLWGVIMVPVFGLPALSYWQTFGLIWLINILLPIPISSNSN